MGRWWCSPDDRHGSKTLERVPEDKFDWKPHEKSFSLHQLAAHLAEIPNWTGVTVNQDLFDMD